MGLLDRINSHRKPEENGAGNADQDTQAKGKVRNSPEGAANAIQRQKKTSSAGSAAADRPPVDGPASLVTKAEDPEDIYRVKPRLGSTRTGQAQRAPGNSAAQKMQGESQPVSATARSRSNGNVESLDHDETRRDQFVLTEAPSPSPPSAISNATAVSKGSEKRATPPEISLTGDLAKTTGEISQAVADVSPRKVEAPIHSSTEPAALASTPDDDEDFSYGDFAGFGFEGESEVLSAAPVEAAPSPANPVMLDETDAVKEPVESKAQSEQDCEVRACETAPVAQPVPSKLIAQALGFPEDLYGVLEPVAPKSQPGISEVEDTDAVLPVALLRSEPVAPAPTAMVVQKRDSIPKVLESAQISREQLDASAGGLQSVAVEHTDKVVSGNLDASIQPPASAATLPGVSSSEVLSATIALTGPPDSDSVGGIPSAAIGIVTADKVTEIDAITDAKGAAPAQEADATREGGVGCDMPFSAEASARTSEVKPVAENTTLTDVFPVKTSLAVETEMMDRVKSAGNEEAVLGLGEAGAIQHVVPNHPGRQHGAAVSTTDASTTEKLIDDSTTAPGTQEQELAKSDRDFVSTGRVENAIGAPAASTREDGAPDSPPHESERGKSGGTPVLHPLPREPAQKTVPLAKPAIASGRESMSKAKPDPKAEPEPEPKPNHAKTGLSVNLIGRMKPTLMPTSMEQPSSGPATAPAHPVRRSVAPERQIKVPPPPAVLIPNVVYPELSSKPFTDAAHEIGFFTPEQASELQRKQVRQGVSHAEIAVSEGMLSQEQVDKINDFRVCRIFVDSRHTGSSAFATWEADLKRLIPDVRIIKVDAKEIETLRQRRLVSQNNRQRSDQENLIEVVSVLSDCAFAGGSDLHLLQREDHTEMQLRTNSDLKTLKKYVLSVEEGDRFARALVTGLASVKPPTYNPLEFQDAQIKGATLPGTGLSSIRIIRGPAFPAETGGAFLVARLQYQAGLKRDPNDVAESSARLGLEEPQRPDGEFLLGKMGFTNLQVEMLERLLRRPMGVIVVTGPTGSGKTTTLYECTRHQARLFPSSRLVTIENPPEYPMPWAIQLACESEEFPQHVKYALRMDPDAILLGEIRGVDEALAALAAAMTGHLVLSTLHVTDPFETFTRLELLDNVRLSRQVVCNHNQVIGLISQRRVPIVCDACSESLDTVFHTYPRYMQQALQSWERKSDHGLSKVRVRGAGCPKCNNSKVMREQAVAEVVVTDELLMQECISLGVLEASRRHRKRPGSDKSMLEHAMDLVLAGQMDPDDVQRSVGEIPMLSQAESDGMADGTVVDLADKRHAAN